MEAIREKIKILFLGPCLQSGYEGVPLEATYPSLAGAALSSRFPQLRFSIQLGMLFHPKGLKSLLRYRLAIFDPDIVVITALATFTATQWRTSLLYELAPEIAATARSFVHSIDARLSNKTTFGNLLDKTLDQRNVLRPQVMHPPLQLNEYERLLEHGINQCRRRSSRQVVLLGPGGFNEDTQMKLALQSPELWSAVNQMVIRLGQRMQVPVVNAQEALHEYSGEVYLASDHKFSRFGQRVVAREIETVLADQVAALLGNQDICQARKLRWPSEGQG